MTFLFLDRVAGIVGAPDTLVSKARARIFREPLRHEGLRRLPRDEVRAHVASVVVRVANDKLRQPLMDAVAAHAQEATEIYTIMHGDDAPVRDIVIAAFEGNDVGIDMSAFALGEATPDAVADQVLVVPGNVPVQLRLLMRFGVSDEDVSAIVNEILAPAQIEWSLEALADFIAKQRMPDRGSDEETVRSLFSNDIELRGTGIELLDAPDIESIEAWLDERAMFSSPESDEADVAEVLRLINQKGGGSHTGLDDDAAAADMTAAGAEHEQPAPAAKAQEVAERLADQFAVVPKPTVPVAAEPSDVTRAVTAALKTLFDMTKETDVHMAEVLGVPKAVVAQARKDVTPWSPDAPQLAKLYGLVGRYNDALAAAAGALGALQPQSFEETN